MSDTNEPQTVSAGESLDALTGSQEGEGTVDSGLPTEFQPDTGTLALAEDSPTPAYGEIIQLEATYPLTEGEVELVVSASQNGIPVFMQAWTASGKASPWTVSIDLAGGEWDPVDAAEVTATLSGGSAELATLTFSTS